MIPWRILPYLSINYGRSIPGVFFHGGCALSVGLRLVVLSVMFTFVATAALAQAENAAQSAVQALPSSRVIAAYFHRTQRCPTCLRVSQTVAKVLEDHFSPDLQSGQLQWIEVDFQAPQNARLAKSYHITGPQLVLIRVENGQVVEWQPKPKVWSLLIKPEELDRYVTTGVQAYLQKLLARQSTNSTVR